MAGSQRVYADASPIQGSPVDLAVSQLRLLQTPMTISRHIDPNPAVGKIRAKEKSGAWNRHSQRILNIENEKARRTYEAKRTIELAKQTQAGLAQFGVKYEVTTLANLISQAKHIQQVPTSSTSTVTSRNALEILQAAEAYDIERVAQLLDVPLPRHRTFGSEP